MELKKYKLADIADFNKSSISRSETFKEIIYLDTSSITENVVSGTVIINTKEAPSRAQRKVTNNTIIYSTVRPRLKHYGILRRPQNNFRYKGFIQRQNRPTIFIFIAYPTGYN